MSVRILVVGKKHERWVAEGIQRYEKRLKRPFDVEWVYLPHSAKADAMARQEESERIRLRLKSDEYVVLLDERGESLDSPTFSRLLVEVAEQSQNITLVIGGAYGVDGTIHDRANRILSLSRLVFPHQLVRLILVEQIYRAQEIALGRPYHHE